MTPNEIEQLKSFFTYQMGKIEEKQDWLIDKIRNRNLDEDDKVQLVSSHQTLHNTILEMKSFMNDLKEVVTWMQKEIKSFQDMDKATAKNAADIKKEVKGLLKELSEIDIKESAILAAREVVMLINDFSEAYQFIKNVQCVLGNTDLKAFESLPNLKDRKTKNES